MIASVRGMVTFVRGQYGEARAHLLRARAINREMDYRYGEAMTLGNLGAVLGEQGRPDEARAVYAQALALHRALGDRRSEGVMLSSLGAVDQEMGRPDAALAHLDAARAIHREVGNRRSEGVSVLRTAMVRQQQGRTAEARALYDEALALHRAAGDRRFEGTCLCCLGTLQRDLGDPAARATFADALAVLGAVGDRNGEAVVLRELGLLDLREGRLDEAGEHLVRSRALLGAMGSPTAEGATCTALARLAAARGDHAGALALLDQAERRLRPWSPVELAWALLLRAELLGEAGRDALAEAASLAPWHAALAAEVARMQGS
jgi:tetratricopeptide (TPR) repeat protein